jgi:hypothetical protein
MIIFLRLFNNAIVVKDINNDGIEDVLVTCRSFVDARRE